MKSISLQTSVQSFRRRIAEFILNYLEKHPANFSALYRHVQVKLRDLYLENPAYRRHFSGPKTIRKITGELVQRGHIGIEGNRYVFLEPVKPNEELFQKPAQKKLKSERTKRKEALEALVLSLLTTEWQPTRKIYLAYLKKQVEKESPPLTYRRISQILQSLEKKGKAIHAILFVGRYGKFALWRLKKHA